jgi:purine-binding chemotaxis protein CheW
MSESARLFERTETLRREFDRGFAHPPHTASEAGEHLLAIRVGGETYAVRLAEVAGLYVDRKVVALPSPVPELLGIVGIRGSISPVYDLGALLGYPLDGVGRWLMSVGKTKLIGVAFPTFDGYVRAARQDFAREEGAESARRHVREVVRMGNAVRPVINLASVIEAITRRVRVVGPSKGALDHAA